MAYTYKNSSFYDVIFKDLADPRTNDWFLIQSPVPGIILIVVYLFFVKVWGPKYMDKRKPADLTLTLIVYNFLQVLLSIFLVYEVVDGLFVREDYSFKCQPLITEKTREAMREARCVYFYFLAKLTELLDTVFFVLRKKNNQVSFLHVYHHTIMPIISWGFVKYCPGGHVLFVVFINSFIHIIMYLYYMLAACGPQVQKYLWWKKYITLLQLIQFLMVLFHSSQLFYTDCNYPKASILIVVLNSLVFLQLFSDFYQRTYKKDKTKAVNGKAEKVHVN